MKNPTSTQSNQTSSKQPSDSSSLEATLDDYLELALKACDGAGKILSNHFGNLQSIDEKFQAGLVSEADRNSENFIVGLIRSRFPDHAILGEESGLSAGQGQASAQTGSSPLWMIDPLDGTTNYVHQFPFFCISIGLEIGGKMVVGVVDAPMLGLRFQAVAGGGAFLNGKSIRVSTRNQFKDGLFATGFSSNDDSLDEQLQLVSKIVRESRGLRRAGAAALDLCYVASGVFDVFWEKHLQPWDTAAGSLIAKEAGAMVTSCEGHEFNPRMKSVLCGNPVLHAEFLKTLAEIRKTGASSTSC